MLESPLTDLVSQLQDYNIYPHQHSDHPAKNVQVEEFSCEQCDYRAARRYNLKKHVDVVHEKVKLFTCKKCYFKTGAESTLKSHVEVTHDRIKRFECQQCNYRAGSKYNLKQHIKEVHEGIKDFKCDQCAYKAARRNHLGKHMQAVHGTIDYENHMKKLQVNKHMSVKMEIDEGEHMVPDDESVKKEIFEAKMVESVKEMMESYVKEGAESTLKSNERLKRFQCEQCNCRTVSEYNLKQHIKEVHEGIKDFNCTHCDYKAARRTHLGRHIKAIHGNNEYENHMKKLQENKHMSVKLEIVEGEQIVPDDESVKKEIWEGKMVESVKEMMMDQNTSEGTEPQKIRNYLCDQCDYKAVQKSTLKRHVTRFHNKQKDFNNDLKAPIDNGLKVDIQNTNEQIKVFHCEQCNYKAARKYHLRRHTETIHDRSKEFTCELCDYNTVQQSSLKQHVKEVHNGNRHQCDHCSYSASKKQTMEKHVESIHLKLKNFYCEHCIFRTSYKLALKRHIKIIHEQVRDLSCEQCDYKTTTNDNLERHVIKFHEKWRLLGCDQCDYKTARKERLAVHIEVVHDKVKRFKCNQCHYKAGYKESLKAHVEKVHEGDKEFPCIECDYKAPSKYYLKKHVLKAHGGAMNEKRKDFACDQCGYKNYQRSALKFHIKTVHQGIRDFSCEQCDYKAALKHKLRQHIEVIHNKIKRFKCNQCNYKTGYKHRLKEHVEKVHEGGQEFTCVECEYKASSRYFLKKHVARAHGEIHEEVKEYQCSLCDYKTSQKLDFPLHLKRHHDIPEHNNAEGTNMIVEKCHLCEFTASEDILTEHLMSTHGKDVNEDINDDDLCISCMICDYKPLYVWHLLFHLKVAHVKSGDFACEQCTFITGHKQGLEIHEKVMHCKVGSKNLLSEKHSGDSHDKLMFMLSLMQTAYDKICQTSCTICDYKALYEWQLLFHLKAAHEKMSDFPVRDAPAERDTEEA